MEITELLEQMKEADKKTEEVKQFQHPKAKANRSGLTDKQKYIRRLKGRW